MSKIPKELQYTENHAWVRNEEDGTVTVGMTDHAQLRSGEVVFIELPDENVNVHAHDEVCVIESVKTALELYSPVSGKIIAVNHDLDEAPSFVNSDPYGDGWLFRIAVSDPEELKELLDHVAYSEYLENDED